MISAKRIVEIFRTRGGGEDYVSPVHNLPPEEFAHLKAAAGGDLLVAKVSSIRGWFALTKAQLVIERSGEVLRIPFDSISSVEIPKRDMMNPRAKIDGGSLELRMRDGTSASISVQPGGPYFGLMNVLSYIRRVSGPSRGRGLSRRRRRTTNDERSKAH